MQAYLQPCLRSSNSVVIGLHQLRSSTNRCALLALPTHSMPAHGRGGAGHGTRLLPWLLQCWPVPHVRLTRFADAKHA